MARTDTLGNFLTDVANAIREKKNTTEPIIASNFDEEVKSISTKYKPPVISFENATKPITQDLIDMIDTSDCTTLTNCFANVSGTINDINLSNWDISNVTDLSYLFANSSALSNYIKGIDNWNTNSVKTVIYMLQNVSSHNASNILEQMTNWDTSEITNMNSMCEGVRPCPNIDFSTMNLSNVETLRRFCYEGSYSTNTTGTIVVKLPSMNKNTTFESSFGNCTYLKSLEVYFSPVLSTAYQMCKNCTSLTDITIHNQEATSASIILSGLFEACAKLTNVDLSGLQGASKVDNLFYNCTSLEKIDMRNFDFTPITNSQNYRSAFYNVPTDCLIIVKDESQKEWITSKFTNLTNIKTLEEYQAEGGE